MRSLGVIFLADVVGFSKMMSQDEDGTLALIRNFSKDVLKPSLEKHRGKLIKSLGDGWLIEFDSATNAVTCAMECQSSAKRRGQIVLRIGIHLGDVEHEDDDVFGDVVNVAARLESIAEAGDIAISTSTYLCLDQILAKPFNNCGKQTLKNIATPIEVWSTGRINVGSKGLNRKESDNLVISVIPVLGSDNSVSPFAQSLTDNLAKQLDTKEWMDSMIQKHPSDEDFQLSTSVSIDAGRFIVSAVLKAPGGKNLWSDKMAGNLKQINQLADAVGDKISNQVLMEIMKVRTKYK